jgi:hypothetical protein
MTLTQLASAIRNNVVDGLDGISSTSFSTEQLKDEILLTAASTLVSLTSKGLIDLNKFSQRIDGIRIERKDVSGNCDVESNIEVPHFTIPDVNRLISTPITYLGSMDGAMTFKVYFDRDYRFHKYRLASARFPFAWVSTVANSDGMHDVFLFNVPTYNNMQFVTIEAVFDNPYDIQKTPYYEQFSDAEFYAPLFVQKEIIDKLTQQYVNYYRQLHLTPKPNTQQA